MDVSVLILTGEVVASNVVDLGVLDESPVLGLLQVVQVVVVGSAEVSAETAVVAGDDDAASAGGLLLVDAVLDTQAGGLDGIVQGGGVLVVADAAEVDDAVGGQDVLGATGGVLGSTTGNELGVEVVEEVLVEAEVLLLGEDGVVGLEVVLLQQGLITDGLDVCDCGNVSDQLLAWVIFAFGSFIFLGDEGSFQQSALLIRTEKRVLQADEAEILGGSHCDLRYEEQEIWRILLLCKVEIDMGLRRRWELLWRGFSQAHVVI